MPRPGRSAALDHVVVLMFGRYRHTSVIATCAEGGGSAIR